MKPLRLIATLVIVSVLLVAGATSAHGAGSLLAQAPAGPGVGELWEEFPLEDGRSGTDADRRVKPDAELREAPATGSEDPAASVPPPPQQTPAAQATGTGADDDNGSSSAIWIVLLIVALVVVDIYIFLRVRRARRRRRQASSYPVWGHSSNVYAEGSTDRDEIGDFRGFVYAMGSGTDSEPDRMLCVHDPSRDEPIWVRRSEVDSLSTGGFTRSEGVGQATSKAPTARAPWS